MRSTTKLALVSVLSIGVGAGLYAAASHTFLPHDNQSSGGVLLAGQGVQIISGADAGKWKRERDIQLQQAASERSERLRIQEEERQTRIAAEHQYWSSSFQPMSSEEVEKVYGRLPHKGSITDSGTIRFCLANDGNGRPMVALVEAYGLQTAFFKFSGEFYTAGGSKYISIPVSNLNISDSDPNKKIVIEYSESADKVSWLNLRVDDHTIFDSKAVSCEFREA